MSQIPPFATMSRRKHSSKSGSKLPFGSFVSVVLCRFLTVLVLVASVSLWSCQRYVQDTAQPLSWINDSDLNQESQIPVLLSGLGGYLGYYQRFASLWESLLSDEFTSAAGVSSDAVVAWVREFDNGAQQLDLTTPNDVWGRLGALRFHSQNLLERVPKIQFTQDSNRLKCLYLGWFHLALVDHYQATFFGLSARRGGGVIAGGPFIPSAQLHDSALAKFTSALQLARTDYERRLVQSFIARVHLLQGRYPQALAAATSGLQSGNAAYSALYNSGSFNIWIDYAWQASHQIIPDPRFRAYVVADSAEAGRIPLERGQRPATTNRVQYYLQAKYTTVNSPIELMTWQENSLMIAEVKVRSGDAAGALVEVNRVRAAVPAVVNAAGVTLRLAPRTTTNLDSIYIERDKQLFATGMRLADQRRFNRWHFPPQLTATAWYYLPIPQSERNTNPNLSGQ